MQSENKIFWRYTRRNLLAMGFVGGAIVIGAHEINQALELNRLETTIISTASAQHTLAQQLVLLPDRIEAETNEYTRNLILGTTQFSVNQMRAGHSFLVNGAARMDPPAKASDDLERLYFAGGLNLDRNMQRFLDAYDLYLDNPEQNHEAIRVAAVNAENFLLISLDQAIDLHAKAAEEKMGRAIELHGFWVAVALFLIVIVTVFILRPLARSAAQTVAAISAERDEGASLLSRSFKIARLGHWRSDNPASDQVWLSKEIVDLLDLALEEGFHAMSHLQLDDIGPKSDTDQDPLRRVWDTGSPSITRSQFTKPNGTVIDLIVHMDAELDQNKNVVGVVGVAKDITAEADAERALVVSHDLLERKSSDLVEAQRLGKLGTWRLPIGSDKIDWDESAYHLMGLDPDTFDTTAENIGRLYVDDDFTRVTALKSKVVETGEPQSDTVQARNGNGSLIDLHIHFKLEKNALQQPIAIFGTIQDVSTERAAARELEKLAYYDGLTGLANRTLFTRELNRVSNASAQGNHQAALLVIDLDHFKEVNDTLGHQAGDELLAIIGHRLAEVFSQAGFVARLGGDEFAVILENNISKEDINKLCNNIIAQVSNPALLSLGTVQTNASIGIALAPQNASEPEELLSFADLALYSSKEQGRSRWCYYDATFSEKLEARTSLGIEVRSALDEDRFEAHYQPIVDVGTETVRGFEALLRLPTTDGGFIPPSDFIPVAESSHLIADVGSFILHKACTDAQSWVAAGQPRRTVSVNVSAAQIWHGDLERVVDSALKTSGLDPQLLCIELTESVFVADNFDKLNRILCRLKSRGIQLALDDFGTGYSSLGYLNRLPFDTLKIDRMFVTNAHTSDEKYKMLRGVVSLAKGLDLKVTAEGVETDPEIALVRELGCDAVQGWLYSKALPGALAIAKAARIDAKTLDVTARSNAEGSRNRRDTRRTSQF